MTHEEAISWARSTNAASARMTVKQASDFLAAYLEARGAVLCDKEPAGWQALDGGDIATNDELDYRGKEHSERVRKLYTVPLYAALSEKGEAS